MENTILHGWTPGLGPDDRPYRECNPRELIGSRRRKPAVNQI